MVCLGRRVPFRMALLLLLLLIKELLLLSVLLVVDSNDRLLCFLRGP